MKRITAAWLAGLALSYKWANGHLVRDGWFCENRSAD